MHVFLGALLLAPILSLAPPSPPLELSLDAAVEHALVHNADLMAGSARVLAARERAEAAGRRPPLRLSLNPASLLEQASAFLGDVLGISSKRKYDSRIARQELAATVASEEEFRLELIASVRSTYWSLALGEERLRLASEAAALLERVTEDARALREKGAATTTEVLLAEAEAAEARGELAEAEEALATDRARLARLLGLPADSAVALTDAPAVTEADIPDAATLTALAERQRPAMAEIAAIVAGADARVGLARAERRPTVTLEAAYEEMRTFGIAGIEFPLIDFGTIRHGIRATEAERKIAEAQLEALRQELRAELSTVLARLSSARARYALGLERERGAGSLLTRDSERAELGDIAASAVREAQHRALLAQLERQSAQLDVLLAEIALERATGIAFDQIGEAAAGLANTTEVPR